MEAGTPVSSGLLPRVWAQASAWLPPTLTSSPKRGRAGPRRRIEIVLSYIAYLSAIVLVIAVGLLITGRIATLLWKYVKTPAEIYVDTVKWDGADTMLADSVRERFRQWGSLRADVDHSAEVLFAAVNLSRAQGELEKLEVNIAGVPVIGALGVIQKIVDPPYRVISLQGETRNDTHYLLARLKEPGSAVREWRLSRPFERSKSDVAKDELIDDMVFNVLFDLGKESFPNKRALEAYVRGTEGMRAYLTTQEQGDLAKAIENLRIVDWEMPGFEPGLDLYALALTEDRKEAEAIGIYNQLLGVDGPLNSAALQGLDTTGRARKYQLALNRSQAYYFQYDVSSFTTATEHLINVRKLIAADLAQSSLSAADRAKLHSLSAFASAQLADVIGHLIAITRHDTGVDVALVTILNQGRTATDEPPLAKRSEFPALTDFADAVAATNTVLLEQAEIARNAASSYWISGGAHAQSERRALQRLIDSSRGYTRYHRARLTATDGKAFKKECELAIKDLERALAAQPQHYTVLQNLGRVYADEAVRVNDPQFKAAIDFFERSERLKPNDYWAHSNLAKLYGSLLENPATPKSELEKARREVDAALTLRFNSAELFLTSARVAMWEWEQAAAADREARQTVVERLLQQGAAADQWDVEWAHAAWAVHGLRGFASAADTLDNKKKEYESSRSKAVKIVQDASDYYARHTTWAARQLKDRLDKERGEINATEYERRALITPIF
jgi:hypothetical protein